MSDKFFSVGNPNHSRKASQIRIREKQIEELKEYAEDLETSIMLNKQLLFDIVTSTKSPAVSSADSALQESEVSHINFPSRTYEKLLAENKQIEEIIHQYRAQMDLASLKISRSEENTELSRRHEEQNSVALLRKIEELRSVVKERELNSQNLEDLHKELEQEVAAIHSNQQLVENRPALLDRVKVLSRDIYRQLGQAEEEREQLLAQCKNIEEELLPSRRSYGKGKPTLMHHRAVEKEFGLQLTFENYLFPDRSQKDRVNSVSACGSDSSNRMEGNYPPFPEYMKSMAEKYKPPQVAEEPTAEPHDPKLEEFLLAAHMKDDEISSLNKLSNYLAYQKKVLQKSINDFKMKGDSEPSKAY